MLTLDNCLNILENIKGLIVVDSQGRIIFFNKRLAEMSGLNPEKIIGKPIKEIVPTNRLDEIVVTRETEPAEFYFLKSSTFVSSRYPIYQGDQFFGAIEYDLFDNYKELKDFLKKTDSLPTKLSLFKQQKKKNNSNKYSIDNIVGKSPKIEKMRKEIVAAAKTNSTVLITGESGSGKELVAHSIHSLSERNDQALVSMNCSAIPFELFESELFGFEEGTFTNARKGGQMGKFQLANHGTLFMDEINQMPLSLQPKILRVLQEKEVDKIGGKYSIPVDARVICASNQNLKELVERGKFREDLYYRLNVIQVRVPSLRERIEDIPILVSSAIEGLNHFLNRSVEGVSDEVINLLSEYHWPGNVRELQNTLERAMNGIDNETRKLTIEHFEFFIEETLSLKKEISLSLDEKSPLDAVRDHAEREAILEVLRQCDGNKSQAAKLLKISRPLLYQKMKRLNIG
jgi:transcriptional regulator with PAS, ATPase and Fis domain